MSHEPAASTHDDDHEKEHIRKHIRFYWAIFGALILGTILTVGVPAYFHFSNHTINIVIGLAIAVVKAALVALFFMHLSHEKNTIYLMIGFATVFAIVLFVITGLAYMDHIYTVSY